MTPPARRTPTTRARSAAKRPAAAPRRPRRTARTAATPRTTTLAIDIGGTALKAELLDEAGKPLVDRVRTPTVYPMPPEALVAALVDLVAPLTGYDRVSVGFPGVVRDGVVLSAPHFVTRKGPGSPISARLSTAWQNYHLAEALQAALGDRPVRLANDADLQGSAVVSGEGLELVLTLGTGLGSAVYSNGALVCHLELAHHPFRKGESYNEQVGEAARKRVGARKWNRRVALAVATIDALLFPDRIYVGGGNSRHVTADLGPKVTLVDNAAGLLGGITLWRQAAAR